MFLYFTDGKVFKRECSDPGCGVCSTCTSCGNLGNGCLDSRIQHRYLLHITCVTTEGDWENDSGTETLIVDVEQNPAPTINLDGKNIRIFDGCEVRTDIQG